MQENIPPNLPDANQVPQPSSASGQQAYQPPYGGVPPMLVVDRDSGHLNTLALMHYVLAGLMFLQMLFLCGHYMFMSTMMQTMASHPPSPASGGPTLSPAGKDPFPDGMMDMFIWFYIIFGLILLVGIVMNVLSARWIKQRKNRMFSMVVAAINCLQMPLGTILGIFTIIVLIRPSVVQTSYKEL